LDIAHNLYFDRLHSSSCCTPFFLTSTMSTRAPPPNGFNGRYGWGRTYRSSLRPVVAVVSGLSALWSLFSAIGFFRAISLEKHENSPKLALFAVIIGAVSMALFAVEAFGVLAAALQRAAIVRLFAFASFAAIALVTGSGVLRVIVHFTDKSEIIHVCTDLSTGATFAVYPFGFWGPEHHETLNAADAASWCNSQYDRDSWQLIISLLVTMLIWTAFSMLAWGYYRQVLDPTSVVNSFRAPSNNYAMGNQNTVYNGASMPNLGYAAPYANPNPIYAPPPGAPPPRGLDANKPPGYTGGDGAVGYGQDDKQNPFADFDERVERDVTSRPAPGGRSTFD